MSLMSLRGRLRRRDWWLFAIPFHLAGWAPHALIQPAKTDPLVAELFSPTGFLIGALVFLALAWPFFSISARRAHDQARPTKALVGPYFVMLAAQILLALLALGQMQEALSDTVFVKAARATLIMYAAATAWSVVLLGLPAGTEGPNAFGPSPGRRRGSRRSDTVSI